MIDHYTLECFQRAMITVAPTILWTLVSSQRHWTFFCRKFYASVQQDLPALAQYELRTLLVCGYLSAYGVMISAHSPHNNPEATQQANQNFAPISVTEIRERRYQNEPSMTDRWFEEYRANKISNVRIASMLLTAQPNTINPLFFEQLYFALHNVPFQDVKQQILERRAAIIGNRQLRINNAREEQAWLLEQRRAEAARQQPAHGHIGAQG
tara:strand:- start:6039 stop:6671 length:633 start_codon:yes stop_codon:yes gene_type:complete